MFLQHRSIDECKTKLTNLKRKLRSASAKHRSDVLKTDGGPAPASITFQSEPEAALYQHIALSIDGLPAVGDSDDIISQSVENIDQIIQVEHYELTDINADEDSVDENNVEDDNVSSSSQMTQIEFPQETQQTTSLQSTQSETTTANKDMNWGKYNPKMLRSQKNPILRIKRTETGKQPSPGMLPSSVIKLRELKIRQRMNFDHERHEMQMKFEQEKHENLLRLEDGKLREQQLRIQLLEAELRSKTSNSVNQN